MHRQTLLRICILIKLCYGLTVKLNVDGNIYYNFNRKCHLLSGNELKDLRKLLRDGANLMYIWPWLFEGWIKLSTG